MVAEGALRLRLLHNLVLEHVGEALVECAAGEPRGLATCSVLLVAGEVRSELNHGVLDVGGDGVVLLSHCASRAELWVEVAEAVEGALGAVLHLVGEHVGKLNEHCENV